eukprot:CAMPEP_0172757146 /NCGR_PEP_ID=MMETSP1074-20121228/163190_1 /TAXON_ID=2916 /ORGANISM="Ceratium fusus, Strain PA161109" /LENGTH=54 /DNA_ID=CAMNT_0013590523 /DNA_START=434 /DNA_END=595 /DNA_ORIENTATION=-
MNHNTDRGKLHFEIHRQVSCCATTAAAAGHASVSMHGSLRPQKLEGIIQFCETL